VQYLDFGGVCAPSSLIMNAVAEKSDDDDIFKSQALQYILEFKWKKYA